MKTLGIIGGLAPATTIDYYRLIVEGYREQRRDGSYPSILINSIDLDRLIRLVTQDKLPELAEWLAGEIQRLAGAGASFGLISSNTPHVVFDELNRHSPIPLLSIVDAAAEAVEAMGLKSVGLLGTRYTMQGRFYPEVFRRHGIVVHPPTPADLDYVHDKYMGELIQEKFLPETRQGVHAVIQRMKQAGIEGVLLAGTELTLLLRNSGDQGLPLLDTTRIHVRRAVAELLS